MTKQELVSEVSQKTGIDKYTVSKTIESLMETIQVSMCKNKPIYLRGFGTFLLKKRAQKAARNIAKKTKIIIPEHFIPFYKPSKAFVTRIKAKKV